MTKQPDVRRHRDGISIHTSAREVTRRSFGSSFFVRRFQSTLPQGKWRCDRILWQSRICISIHTSAREVTRLAVRDIATMTISIHTSAREVTALRKMYGSNCVWFQSTLPQGKWQYGKSKNRRALWFQSTLPQGKWLNVSSTEELTVYFNPHFHKGSDCILVVCVKYIRISIHTSTREVTKCLQSV